MLFGKCMKKVRNKVEGESSPNPELIPTKRHPSGIISPPHLMLWFENEHKETDISSWQEL
jgi:hypothetical protein